MSRSTGLAAGRPPRPEHRGRSGFAGILRVCDAVLFDAGRGEAGDGRLEVAGLSVLLHAGASVLWFVDCVPPTKSFPGMSEKHNVVILGSGCAGNTAAIYTARANLRPLVLEGHEPGGQLSITTEVENFPGFPEGVMGPVLVQNMKTAGATLWRDVTGTGASCTPNCRSGPSRWSWKTARRFRHGHLIIATGASARWLNLPNEQKLIGHGVSSCATCDGFFFRGKKIMVIGGGDSAMEEANFLSRFGSEVAVVHRSEDIPRIEDHAGPRRANPKITVPHEHGGQRRVRRRERRSDRSASCTTWPQRKPTIAKWMDSSSRSATFRTRRRLPGSLISIRTDTSSRTEARAPTLPASFTPGDVQDRIYRQAITASGAGCMAAIEAERFFEAEGH